MRHVEGELAGIEGRERAKSIEESFRVTSQAELTPRNESARDDVAGDLRWWKGERKIQDGRCAPRQARPRPDGRRDHVVGHQETKQQAAGLFLAKEVEDAMTAGTAARHERGPCRRRQCRDRRRERRACAVSDQTSQDRHRALIKKGIQDVEGRAVDADEQRAMCHTTSAGAAATRGVTGCARCAATKSAHSPIVTSRMSRWPISANSFVKGSVRLKCS